MASEILIRETPHYRVYDSGNSITIEAKERGTAKPRMRLNLARTWDATIWRQLQTHTSDESFDATACLELGIGTFMKPTA